MSELSESILIDSSDELPVNEDNFESHPVADLTDEDEDENEDDE
jgi:hypothetical protein